MSIFPSVLNTFNRPTTTDRLNSPSHSALHNTVSSALGQVEAYIGRDGNNSVAGTLVYQIQSPDSDGGGHVQTANKGGTGQTSYTKGDMLVAPSTSVLSKLAVGANDQVLIADSAQSAGVKWGAVPAISVSSVIGHRSSVAVASVWTKPAAATVTSKVFVEVWGGGGSGGINIGTGEAGGGGGGGYTSGWFIASVLSSSVLLNVGRGGHSKVSGSNNPGFPGHISVFDVQSSLLTGYAGGGGGAGSTGAGGGGGGTPLGSGSGGSGAAGGLAGGNNFFSSVLGGNGAGSANADSALYGGGGGGASDASTATTPGKATYGGGGGGGVGSSILGAGGVSIFGGNGSAGSVITAGSVLGGSVPGGGGGAAYGIESSGEGGAGMIRITTFL